MAIGSGCYVSGRCLGGVQARPPPLQMTGALTVSTGSGINGGSKFIGFETYLGFFMVVDF